MKALKFVAEIIIYAVIATIIIMGCVSILPGCGLLTNTTKGKQHSIVDSTTIRHNDSGRVVNNYFNNKSDSTWYREIINLVPKGRDTTINNTTVPVNNYYPAQIIREGGSFTQDDVARLVDSMNRSKSDTTHVATDTTTKSKESKPPVMLIIFIGLGILVLFCTVALVILSKMHVSIKSLKQ